MSDKRSKRRRLKMIAQELKLRGKKSMRARHFSFNCQGQVRPGPEFGPEFPVLSGGQSRD